METLNPTNPAELHHGAPGGSGAARDPRAAQGQVHHSGFRRGVRKLRCTMILKVPEQIPPRKGKSGLFLPREASCSNCLFTGEHGAKM